MNTPHIWLRAETKPFEHRTPLTPQGAAQLIAAGFKVTVERSQESIFNEALYRQADCHIAAAGSWRHADKDAIILGLKELPEATHPLEHAHIYFAHAYKEQQGWQDLLGRFKAGNGKLYDLEYLLDDNNRRIAAFGYWAGFAGAALGLQGWAHQQHNQSQKLGQKLGQLPPLSDVNAYADKQALFADIKTSLAKLDYRPRLLVIGALGRSGSGAADFADEMGIEVVKWDLAETQKGGPFTEINQMDIMVNCVFVQQQLPPFITPKMLTDKARKLSMIVDVSCDPYSSFNPLPIYDRCTTFKSPCLSLIDGDNPLDLIAIDHLPSLLPKESSEDYSAQLLEHLKTLGDKNQPVWSNALQIFQQKSAQL
ncbi:MAG: saccharopine dehydrogenase (NAD+, L-lysine-forming) [Phenylobacterium sp.]|jgi:saccharopine dehydrogenase (NAD+, L-lysine-forming)